MRVGIVVAHIFMQDALLDNVIFSPGALAIDLANGLVDAGHEVHLYTPGPVTTTTQNITADMSGFEDELKLRGYGYIELLKKHPLTFVTLARQVQAALIAQAFADANQNQLDVAHIYTNEEDIGLQFAEFCTKPVVFTHHDPYNFSSGYRALFPHKPHLNYIAISESQKKHMPSDTNWLATIYHGQPLDRYHFERTPEDYVLFIGRVVAAKGTHLAIKAVKHYNEQNPDKPLKLKIAGKHYGDSYFADHIEPELDDCIEYVGFVNENTAKQALIGHAKALIVPSVFEEPFGLVLIESLACGTPVIGLDSGAIPEVITNDKTGYVVPKTSEQEIIKAIANNLSKLDLLDRSTCRAEFEARFTTAHMVEQHVLAYQRLLQNN